MLTRDELCRRRCVEGLIQVVEQTPFRAAARPVFVLDNSTVASLLLWTMLRWERTFLIRCLEGLGIDMWRLTCDVDDLLKEQIARSIHEEVPQVAVDPRHPAFRPGLDRLMKRWLDRAQGQAEALGHAYLGTEHLLLAIVAAAEPALAAVLARHGIEHGRLRDAITAALAQVSSVAPDPPVEKEPEKPWYLFNDTPAAGVPRRFGMAVMMILMTMYAVLFAAMQASAVDPPTFVAISVLATGVGFCQMALFKGKYPRAASIWAGACLLPVIVIVALIAASLSMGNPSGVGDVIFLILGSLIAGILSIPFGAAAGYLLGGLTAGVFLLMQRYAKPLDPEPSPEDSAPEDIEA